MKSMPLSRVPLRSIRIPLRPLLRASKPAPPPRQSLFEFIRQHQKTLDRIVAQEMQQLQVGFEKPIGMEIVCLVSKGFSTPFTIFLRPFSQQDNPGLNSKHYGATFLDQKPLRTMTYSKAGIIPSEILNRINSRISAHLEESGLIPLARQQVESADTKPVNVYSYTRIESGPASTAPAPVRKVAPAPPPRPRRPEPKPVASPLQLWIDFVQRNRGDFHAAAKGLKVQRQFIAAMQTHLPTMLQSAESRMDVSDLCFVLLEQLEHQISEFRRFENAAFWNQTMTYLFFYEAIVIKALDTWPTNVSRDEIDFSLKVSRFSREVQKYQDCVAILDLQKARNKKQRELQERLAGLHAKLVSYLPADAAS